MDNVIRVLVVDEYPIVRWALCAFLDRQSKFCVVGEAGSLAEALALVRQCRPDVVTTEIRFSDSSMLHPSDLMPSVGMGVVAFSDHDSWDKVESFLNEGGLGFVSKKSALSELKAAIEAAANRRRWISPRLRGVQASHGFAGNQQMLTRRETEIVTLVASGLTSKQIADKLCVSLRTVENHRHRVFKKLGIKRSAELVIYAMERGLVGPSGVS